MIYFGLKRVTNKQTNTHIHINGWRSYIDIYIYIKYISVYIYNIYIYNIYYVSKSKISYNFMI